MEFTTTTGTETATVTLPGRYLSHFEGSMVGQSQPGHGYDGCDDLGALVATAPRRRCGRGYLATVTVTADHLICLLEEAEVMAEGVEYGDANHADLGAAEAVEARCRAALDALGIEIVYE
jgi:hypothetical protein